MASCSITSTCGLAQEATQYTSDEFVNLLTTLYKLPSFKNAVKEAERRGVKDAIMNYHKDGSPTYQSMIRFLGVLDENALDETELGENKAILESFGNLSMADTSILFNTKLVSIVKNKLGDNAKFVKDAVEMSIKDLNYRDAVDIATTFNLQNAVRDKFIAVVRKDKGEKNFKVQIVTASEENINEMKNNLPKYAAIDALVDFFERIGLKVDFDQFNDIVAGVINKVYPKYESTDTIWTDSVQTVISLCTNENDNYNQELPKQISRNAAVVAARILMVVAEKNSSFKESIGYQRLETAVQRYINTHPDDKTTVESLMEDLITNEIETRINKNIDRRIKDSSKAQDKMLGYVRQRVKTFFTKLKEFFKDKNDLIKKWKSEKFQNKEISIKELRRKASLAVTEMFKEESTIKTTIESETVTVGQQYPSRRQALKRYTNDALRRQTDRHNETQKLLVKLENRYKKHLRFLLNGNYTKEATKFEKDVDKLETYFSQTNSLGSVSSQKDVASKAVSQTLINLSSELAQLDVDLNALHNKMLRMIPDYSNPEYMKCVSDLLSLHSRYELICGVVEDIRDALQHSLINPEVTRLSSSGVEKSNIKEIMDDMSKPIANMRDGFDATINKANIDLLTQVIGSDTVDIAIGKLMSKKGQKKVQEYLKIKRDGTRWYQSRSIVEDLLKNPSNLRTSLYHRWLGSIQNSANLLNQISYLAVNRANMEAHNNTQRILYIITEGRRKRGRLQKTVIERDEQGIPTGNLIRPIDYTKYEKELKEQEIKWGEQFTKKYKENDYTRDQLAMLWKDFRQQQFNEWNKYTTPDGKSTLRYKKQKMEITHPITQQKITIEIYAPNKDVYPNYAISENDTNVKQESNTARWDNLSVEEKETSDWFFALKYFSDLKLDGQGSGAHVIPQFRGNAFDTFWGNKIVHLGTLAKNSLSRGFLEDMDDTDFGATQLYTPFSNERYYTTEEEINDKVKRIPLYGVRKLKNMDGLSTDLYSSYLAYDDMSNNYNAKSKVEVLLTSVHTQTNKSLAKNNPNNLSEKSSLWKGFTFEEEFERFVDKEIYGIKRWDKSFSSVRIRLSKIVNHIGRLTTVLFLGGNWHSAFVNLITGYNEIVKEAGVGEYINKTDLIKAMGTYMHHAQFKKIYLAPKALNKDAPRGFLPYFNQQPADSPGLVNQVLRDFDFTERFVKDIQNYTTNTWDKIGKLYINPMRLIMLPYEVTDHWMQAVPLIAMLNHEKVYDRDSKEISLMQAMYGRNQAVKKPDYIDTRNRFGIFYKTDEDRVKGEEVLKILEEIVTNINDFKDKPNYQVQFGEEENVKKYLSEHFSLPLPTTLKELEDVQQKLNIKFESHIFNNSEMAKFQLKTREIVNRMHGVYDSRSKGALDKTFLGALCLSMKNYAVGLINRRLMEGHWNLVLNKWDEGSLVTVGKVIANAFGKSWKEAGVWNTTQTLLALISPYVGHKGKGLSGALLDSGFSESQIYNLKRAKLDVLRVWAFGVLRNIIQGLSQGWIGGYDDDEDKRLSKAGKVSLFEDMLSLNESFGITRKDVESGKAFEKNGPLHSTVTLRDIVIELGYAKKEDSDDKIIEGLLALSDYPNGEEDFIRNVLALHLDDLFIGYGDTGGINSGVEKWYTDWCNEDEVSRYRYKRNKETGEITREKGTGKRKKGKLNFEGAFERALKEKLGDGNKIPKTPVQSLISQAKDQKERLNKLLYEYQRGHLITKNNLFGEEGAGFQLPFTSIQNEIRRIQNQLTAVEFIKQGFNKYYASLKMNKEYNVQKKQFFREYNVNSIAELKDKYVDFNYFNSYLPSDNRPTAEQLVRLNNFLESYEDTEKKLDNAEKYLRTNKFEDAYFETEHPNLKYWLGVATYFAERSLIEQESFIPFADIVARKGGALGANWIGGSMKTLDEKFDIMPEIFHYSDVEAEDWHFVAMNEWSNLISIPAASASITATKDIFTYAWDAMTSPNEEEYNKQVENIRRQILYTTDETVKEELQSELYELQSNWNQNHVQNNSAKLKKGEHVLSRYKSFIPYYRTLHMLGFFNYLDGLSLQGGYQATEAFKSFYYKEDKYKQKKK